MLNILKLNKIDSKKMYQVYDNWPKMAKNAYEKYTEITSFENIDHIIFAGMGGSGSIGDIFSAILSKKKIYVSVIKGYLLPKTVDENTLLVITSISGNTEETLTILKTAKNMNCKIIAFSAGGKMESYCKKHNIEYIKILETNSPRASFPSFVFAMLKILNLIIPIEKKEIEEAIENLEKLQQKINSKDLTKNNPAVDIANWIKSIPVIYYPLGLQAAAIRFKSSLQENSKTHAMAEDIVEATHNGIVAWEKKSSIQPILIEGFDDYHKTKERWKILKEYFEEKAIDYKEVFSIDGNILSKLINLIYLLDFSTIYHSIINNVDPTPVISIDFVKSKL